MKKVEIFFRNQVLLGRKESWVRTNNIHYIILVDYDRNIIII